MLVNFIPLIMFLIYLGFLTYWVFAAVYIYSSGTIEPTSGFPWGTVDMDGTLKGYMAFHFICLIWISEYFSAVSMFLIASSACMWYFYRDSKQGGHAIRSSITSAIMHTGSFAFGALIMTIIDLIKLALYYVIKKYGGKKKTDLTGTNFVTRTVLGCCLCIVECFERFVRYVNRNAYINIALNGNGFCKSAW